MEQTFKRATWEQLAKGITGQFGESCEVVIHDLTQDMDHTIVYIENGHVTGRKVGDGSSKIVIETLNSPSEELKDRINYRTQTEDGKFVVFSLSECTTNCAPSDYISTSPANNMPDMQGRFIYKSR